MSKKSFDPAEAALEGFRVVAKRWGHVLGWAVLAIVAAAVVLTAMMIPALPLFEAAKAADAAGREWTREEAVQRLLQFSGIFGIAAVVGLIFAAVWNCAVFRIVLRPEEGGFLMLRLGADEVRSLLTSIVIALLLIVVIVLTVGVVAVGVGYLSQTEHSSWAALAGVVGGIFCAVIWIWACVRLSLVLPYTFHMRRFAFGSGIALSGGVFWKLLGMWLLAFIIYVAISTIGGSIVQMPAFFALPALAGIDSGQDVQIGPLLAILIPIGLVVIVGSAIIQVISSLLLVAPGAAAVRDLTAESA